MVKKSSVARFDYNGIVLEDGSFEAADCVILCTGYKVHTGLFEKSVLEILNFDETRNKSPFVLYNYTFHPKLANLAILNHERRINTIINVELQAKLACSVFSGRKQLPSEEIMMRNIDNLIEQRKKGLKDISYNDLMTLLASENGCEPDFNTIKMEDPELHRMLM